MLIKRSQLGSQLGRRQQLGLSIVTEGEYPLAENMLLHRYMDMRLVQTQEIRDDDPKLLKSPCSHSQYYHSPLACGVTILQFIACRSLK